MPHRVVRISSLVLSTPTPDGGGDENCPVESDYEVE
jgi:hypothetical protein